MKDFKIILKLDADVSSEDDASLLEKTYQSSFKPLLTFLYSHPNFFLTIGFTGYQLAYYAKKHPEAIDLLHDLVQKKQVEILNGGYYAPVFPLLYSLDRTAQIDKLSTLLRATIGKRPSGIYLYGSIWEPSLIPAFCSCSIDYVFLDSSLIADNKKGEVIIACELGKSVKIFPTYKNMKPLSNETSEGYLYRLEQSDYSIISISFSLNEAADFIGHDISEFLIAQNKLTLPISYLTNCHKFIPAYVPAGMDSDFAKWAVTPFLSEKKESRFPISIYDYLNTYSQNHSLYERMMYISMIISQTKGCDKMRKNAAYEKLLEAQSGFNYARASGTPANASRRQKAYRLLNDAENFIKQAGKITNESLTKYDYNYDGVLEYVAQMDKYNAIVSTLGGRISDFNVIKGGSNYASSLSRIQQFDNLNDSYRRGFFVEHLFDSSNFEKYIKSNHSEENVFASVNFVEKKFDGKKKKEVQLEGIGQFSSMKLPVLLKKNYIFSSSGIIVQYILKNESPFEINGYFAVELNIAQTRFDKPECQYSAQLVYDGEKKELPSDENFYAEDSVSFVQILDGPEKRNITIEPNENAGINYSVMKFRRPEKDDEIKESTYSSVISLFWKINLAAGMEKEKTINYSIIPIKKN